jgi:glutamine amidotransferase
MRVAIVDYGAGNLRSAARAFQEAGAVPGVVSDPAVLREIDAVVVPGVGAFAPAMARLRAGGLVEPIVEAVRSGIPLIGICLGMQLLFEASEEGEPTRGLGLLPGRVVRLAAGVKVPHMGWNTIEPRGYEPLFDGLPPSPFVYFVHSYIVAPVDPEVVVAETTYGGRFPAIVRRGRVWGLQFHPEKSSRTGARLLRNLLAPLGGRAIQRSPA